MPKAKINLIINERYSFTFASSCIGKVEFEPIVSKDKIKSKPDCALVLAWNFFEEIKKRNSDLANNFVSIKDLEN